MNNTNKFLRSRPAMLVTAITAVTALAAGSALLFGLHSGPAVANPPAEPPPMPVSVATVAASEVASWDDFSGRLEAVDRVELRSRAAGTVQAVHFREGSMVNKGDLLFTIDPAPYAAEVDRAEAQLVAARSRVLHTTGEQQRAQRLWDERAIAQRELDERSNALREAQAGERAALAALHTAQLSLGYTKLRAPISGRIGRIEVSVGNLVAAGPGAPVLATLVSLQPIYASFDADEQIVTRALKSLPGGSSARAQIERIPVEMWTASAATAAGGSTPTDKPVTGKLQLVDNQVDTQSGTIRVRAVFDNKDGSLIPGQFARLRMGQPQAAQALLINERAVGTDQNKRFVIVIGNDNKAQWREVTLGSHVNGMRVVSSGLKAGERIVVNGLQRVRPGAVVAPQAVAMDAKADAKQAGAQNSGPQPS